MEIRAEAALEALRPAWSALLRDSASASIFLTPEWAEAWWSAYGSRGELRVLAAYDDGGVLRGIAPLRSKPVRKYGQTVETLQFIGDAPSDSDSDYLDFIIAPGYERSVLNAIARHWAKPLRSGSVLMLNEIPETSPNLDPLRDLARGMVWSEFEVPCATVPLPPVWDEYLASLKPRFRTKARSILRNLEERKEVRFRFCTTVGDLDRLLPALFDLHARRWQQAGKKGVFGDPRKQKFYRTIAPVLLERGWLRFSWMEWNGRILACQYGFAYNGVYSQLQEGYEPASEHWNVGIGLRAWSIRDYVKEGLREYDFLGGIGRHKTDWGARLKHSKRIVAAFHSPGNILFLHGPHLEKKARSLARAVLPERLVPAGEKNGTAAAAGQTVPANPGRWRKAVAQCYLHCGAPALIRLLGNRYQLFPRNGGLPRLTRRVEGSARIFYYHRINADNDPFFPALAPELFDVHMRYLSRNYRVLSLPDVKRHLESGSPGLVVGVTFDDGYRDNYECAYPILRRYNLPATIFLTTGSVDSGESLWFNQLAEAVKKTEREFIDLEFDIPRRFWMRTLEERLDSHKQVLALLRALPDAGRRAWMLEILRQLAVMHNRHNDMLTWNQVRLMNANRIDFGGHTVTHPFLSKLTIQEAAWEIGECKRRIDEEVQQPTEFFAYPSGREEDFAAANKTVLRNAGFQAAVTTIWGMNYSSTDPLELRRGGPWETHPALFAMKLDWYQLANQ